MSEPGEVMQPIKWSECCGFTRIFRCFRMSIHWSKLFPAFCGIFATYLAGHLLDWSWPSNSQPAIGQVASHVDNELSFFLTAPGNATGATHAWIDRLAKAGDVRHIGAFSLLLHHARVTTNRITSSVIHADFGGLFEGVKGGCRGLVWLLSMHPLYAIIFFVILVLIWGFFGGVICRAAALDISREEKVHLRDAFSFAKARIISFATVPLIPVGLVLAGAAFLWIAGVFGMIPAIGEVLVGLFFILALLVGFLLALVMICGIAGFPLMLPAIAADNLDALDAISTTFSYVGARPWKTAFYVLTATCYGAICILFVKLFVMIMLWGVGLFMGSSMNSGDAYALDATGQQIKIHSKLDAMWKAPAFSDDRPFIGSFGDQNLRHFSWFGRLCLKAWIYSLWGLVAAFVVSFFYTAGSVIYFLLRRDVDLTDIEDVYLEETEAENREVPAANTPAPSGDISTNATS